MKNEKTISASTERLAWSQTTDGGMGTGLDAYKHKREHKHGTFLRNYYVRTKK